MNKKTVNYLFKAGRALINAAIELSVDNDIDIECTNEVEELVRELTRDEVEKYLSVRLQAIAELEEPVLEEPEITVEEAVAEPTPEAESEIVTEPETEPEADESGSEEAPAEPEYIHVTPLEFIEEASKETPAADDAETVPEDLDPSKVIDQIDPIQEDPAPSEMISEINRMLDDMEPSEDVDEIRKFISDTPETEDQSKPVAKPEPVVEEKLVVTKLEPFVPETPEEASEEATAPEDEPVKAAEESYDFLAVLDEPDDAVEAPAEESVNEEFQIPTDDFQIPEDEPESAEEDSQIPEDEPENVEEETANDSNRVSDDDIAVRNEPVKEVKDADQGLSLDGLLGGQDMNYINLDALLNGDAIDEYLSGPSVGEKAEKVFDDFLSNL